MISDLSITSFLKDFVDTIETLQFAFFMQHKVQMSRFEEVYTFQSAIYTHTHTHTSVITDFWSY